MKKLRKLLYPLAILYDGITLTRNILFDNHILPGQEYDFPVIGVGNLSVGGTGKTPMVEHVLSLLQEQYHLAVLSRGYGRKTKGFLKVTPRMKAGEVGDEPLQIAQKFPGVDVYVDEDRRHGITCMLNGTNPPDVILLDDVFQHRYVRPGHMIMLTSYTSPFYEDLVLPAGDLREGKSGAARADSIVVTKCPPDLSAAEMTVIRKKINEYSGATVYFSAIAYGEFFHGSGEKVMVGALMNKDLTVVTGIARPGPFIAYLKSLGLAFDHKKFSDHHAFTDAEIDALDSAEVIVTTEKDYMRLLDRLSRARVYYLPIKTHFIDGGEGFNNSIRDFCGSFTR
ncbi:MAG: tetraacyldisaccharide 4'-kinase [Cytophagaceae bacterium]|nr:tetraacyldisaccharide 4'-kinase [Cytophagaceae bacterium]|tara:strand:+ start:40235 stop:41251 length:1017 start_codon:yes stop_codon:yes gene_type:complete